jgi:HlyD family type I secretion membrane fusion protein
MRGAVPPQNGRPPAPPDEVPVDLRSWVRAGWLIIVVAFGGVGAWSALAPLEGAVIAPGIVTVISHRKTVQHREGGIVEEILVRDGDAVAGHDLLLRLDDADATATLAILDAKLELLRASEARLAAERDGSEIAFPHDLAERAREPRVAEILGSQRELFEARRAAVEGEEEILGRRIGQLEEAIAGLEAQRDSKQRQIALIEEELAGLRKLFEQGYTSRNRMRLLERASAELEGERGEHVAEIARAQNEIGEARLRSIQIRKNFRESVIDDLHEVQAGILDATERRAAAQDRLARLEVRAPQAGQVVGMSVHTVGAVISPGQPILHIVPEDDELVVEAHVAPSDIDRVSVGQEARVRFSAFDMRTTPELHGVVIQVSADLVSDPGGHQSYYLVRTRIPEDGRRRLGELRLVPGMPAETFIQTGSRTLLTYLVKPLADGLARSFKDA